MKINVDFELLSIDVEDDYFPTDITKENMPGINDLEWKFTYSFSFGSYKKGYELVTLMFSYELLHKKNKEDPLIAYIDLINKFKVTEGLKKMNKAYVLEIFFHMTVANIQGIFAAKCEGQPLADMLPPDIDGSYYHDEILSIIHDDK